MAHYSVLLNEVIDGLDLKPNDVVVDATINGGGHSLSIVESLKKEGRLIGVDQDASALEVSAEKFADAKCQVNLIQNNFRNIDEVLDELDVKSFDKILFDLGWSSNQFENPKRGFSFMHEGPLLMTLSLDAKDSAFTAYDMVNEWELQSLTDVIQGYGEEKYAFRIAKAIVAAREEAPIETTTQLAELIKDTVPGAYRRGRIHPATKTFQALRIAVNDEMGALREGIEKAFNLMSSGGRMLVISFHSIEDRIVKHFFKALQQKEEGKILTKRPITASEEELTTNPRARSAKLRIIQKI